MVAQDRMPLHLHTAAMMFINHHRSRMLWHLWHPADILSLMTLIVQLIRYKQTSYFSGSHMQKGLQMRKLLTTELELQNAL